MISIITPTHNPKYLPELYDCIIKQTYKDWEWVIVVNGGVTVEQVQSLIGLKDPRIKIYEYTGKTTNIGEIKNFSFFQGAGDILLEYDHDDLLLPDALMEANNAFQNEEIGFVYSDCADYSPDNLLVTYHDPNVKRSWDVCGWKFKNEIIDGKNYLAPDTWTPSAMSMGFIFYAPNHFRAWRKSVYHELGGHNAQWSICDDHELMIRTYLHTKMFGINKILYLYRVETNTWSHKVDEIREKTFVLFNQYLHKLVKREQDLSNFPCYDLGGAFSCPDGWTSVDLEDGVIKADLNEKWPFEDNSVGAFRAFDMFEHLPNKMHTMSEVYRCLKPGGWLLSMTPSALGQGAYQDPTHMSYWVCNSFKYYTDKNLAKYIKNTKERFMEARLLQTDGDIPYVIADLVKLDGVIDEKIPGIKRI